MFPGFRFIRSANKSRRTPAARSGLKVEQLEAREVPATLAPISDFTTPNTKALYVPLTVSNVTGTVSYNVSSSNSQVQAQLVQGGTTIRLHVTGKDSTNTDFSGDLTFRLFDSLAPITTARILTLINSGFYNNLTFHRILDGFVAQGGDPSGNGTGGSGTKIPDEFNTLLTFNSPGLLAMANSGDDTGDSQFFITDTDLTLAQQPQHLNFQHTIFGQLVAGFDTFTKLMSTPVNSPNVGTPLSPVRITSATVVANDPNGVLRVTAPANFTGTTTITVTPSDGGASSTGDSFAVTFVADTVNDPPFLGAIADQTTTVGTGLTFQVTSTDLEGDPVTYSVVSATANGQAVDVQARIDQATGRVTVTPPAGFVGTIDLKLGVKDAASQNDTQVIKLTVTGSIDLDTASDTGALGNDNVTGVATPTLTILAPAGQTVTVTVNGTSAGTATATGTAGQYRITLPAGLLRVGTNTIAATAGTTTLTPLTLTYAPSLRNVYVVPGAPGSSQQITFTLTSSETSARSEFGSFRVDNASGAIGNLTPGQAGYFAAALARRNVVFARGSAVGATSTITANGGDILVLYLVQDETSANLLATNPNGTAVGAKTAFFSLTGANRDGVAHVSSADDPLASKAIYGWEDNPGGGDRDYNDMVVTVRRAADTGPVVLQVPSVAGRAVTMTATLKPAKKAGANAGAGTTTAGGEVGFFVVDDASGAIGSLTPGQAGYAAAALNRAQVLFSANAAVNATTAPAVTGGQFLAFYYVRGGTAAQVLSGNPTNSLTGSRVAFFSIAAANPDGGKVHARNFDPERVTRAAPTATDPYWFHMMGTANGGVSDFDDVVFTVQFGA